MYRINECESLKNVVCITNRHLVNGDYFKQIEKICKKDPDAVILREKDMTETDYEILARKVLDICKEYDVKLILHTFYKVAEKLGIKCIHMPLGMLEIMSVQDKEYFDFIGCSCHSREDVNKAVLLGADYVTASHIYKTDCKKGLEPKGILFLKDICDNTDLSVWALGGINYQSQMKECMDAGASAVCIMSQAMKM